MELESIIVIDASGDLVLRITDPLYPSSDSDYRVSADKLRSSSAYFKTLLHPTKWAEGTKFQEDLGRISRRAGGLEAIKTAELPHVSVEYVGRIGKVKDIRPLITDFLRVLHGLDMTSGHLSVPLANLANLSIVADRFDALTGFKAFCNSFNVFTGVGRRKSSAVTEKWSEEKCRMRVLIGFLLNHSIWTQETQQIILKGSQRWSPAEPKDDTDKALWWDLPVGVEEELHFRRDAVVKTLSSLLTRCMALYTSGDLQCKLGYSNSLQCDTYQLGEIVKFYNKLGLLNLETTIGGSDGKDPFEGDIAKAVDLLRQVPTYQIDKFHAHCGLRNRLLPCLEDLAKTFNGLTICGECWDRDRATVSWRQAKAPLTFSQKLLEEQNNERRALDIQYNACWKSHSYPRDFYLANKKTWNIPR